MVGGTVGAQVAGMEIWLGEQAYFHAGTSLSILFPGVKPSLIFTPTGDRGPLAHGREHVAGSAVSSHLPVWSQAWWRQE